MDQDRKSNFEGMASDLLKMKRERLAHELALASVVEAAQTLPDTAERLRASIGSLLLFTPLP